MKLKTDFNVKQERLGFTSGSEYLDLVSQASLYKESKDQLGKYVLQEIQTCVHAWNHLTNERGGPRRKERSAHNALRPTILSLVVVHVISHLDLKAMNIV